MSVRSSMSTLRHMLHYINIKGTKGTVFATLSQSPRRVFWTKNTTIIFGQFL